MVPHSESNQDLMIATVKVLAFFDVEGDTRSTMNPIKTKALGYIVDCSYRCMRYFESVLRL